jgi:hypothetical protein
MQRVTECKTLQRETGLVPHSQPIDPFVEKFVAFLSQIWPRGPFLPVVSVFNYCTVNNLRLCEFHGMEEVVGSNPTRSTKFLNHLEALSRLAAGLAPLVSVLLSSS